MALLLHSSPLLFTAPLAARAAAGRSMRPTVEAADDGSTRLTLALPGHGDNDVSVEVVDSEGGGATLCIHAQPTGESELRCVRRAHRKFLEALWKARPLTYPPLPRAACPRTSTRSASPPRCATACCA